MKNKPFVVKWKMYLEYCLIKPFRCIETEQQLSKATGSHSEKQGTKIKRT